MCIGIFKPANVILSEEILYNCFSNNEDGAGFAVVEKDEKEQDELNIYKGYFDMKNFLKAYEPYKDKQALIHFRVATHRLVNGKNCHPWRVNPNLVFIHNGYITGLSQNSDISDTGIFADEILKPLAKTYSDFWLTPEFKWFIENSIRSGNKLVMMDTKNNYSIFNESAGEWAHDCWFSNTTYKFRGSSWNPWSPSEPESEHIQKSNENVIDVEPIETSHGSTDPEIEKQFETHELAEVDQLLEELNKQS